MTNALYNILRNTKGELDMGINGRIKELRENSGFTQKNIADFLGVDQSLVSKVEKGERSLTSDMLDSLSALFGVPVSSISNNTAVPSTALAFRASDLTAEDLHTIAFINKIALNANFMTEKTGE